jgi:CRISPR-associated endonuclease Cas1
MRIERGTLVIEDGFTHWPQERRTYRFFKGDLKLPPRIVMLDGSGSLSFDVISWLSEQSVALIRAGYQGDVASVIGGSGFAADPDRVRWQVETRNDPAKRVEFCCDLIARKLTNSLHTLKLVVPDSRSSQMAVARAEAGIRQLTGGSVATVDQVRTIERIAAGAYFTAWRAVEISWRSQKKYPVPDNWLTIGSRQSMGQPWQTNRNATHPVNAILNYAYAMLRSQAHIECLAEGYDPRRGIMHHDRDDAGALAFVFDMMEPGRAVVDCAVLKFLNREMLNGADFATRADGVCRLAPQLARRVCEMTSGVLDAIGLRLDD